MNLNLHVYNFTNRTEQTGQNQRADQFLLTDSNNAVNSASICCFSAAVKSNLIFILVLLVHISSSSLPLFYFLFWWILFAMVTVSFILFLLYSLCVNWSHTAKCFVVPGRTSELLTAVSLNRRWQHVVHKILSNVYAYKYMHMTFLSIFIQKRIKFTDKVKQRNLYFWTEWRGVSQLPD